MYILIQINPTATSATSRSVSMVPSMIGSPFMIKLAGDTLPIHINTVYIAFARMSRSFKLLITNNNLEITMDTETLKKGAISVAAAVGTGLLAGIGLSNVELPTFQENPTVTTETITVPPELEEPSKFTFPKIFGSDDTQYTEAGYNYDDMLDWFGDWQNLVSTDFMLPNKFNSFSLCKGKGCTEFERFKVTTEMTSGGTLPASDAASEREEIVKVMNSIRENYKDIANGNESTEIVNGTALLMILMNRENLVTHHYMLHPTWKGWKARFGIPLVDINDQTKYIIHFDEGQFKVSSETEWRAAK